MNRTWLFGLAAGQLALLAATFYLPGLGTAWWHHVASLAVVLVIAASMGRLMTSRRFLGVGVLVTTVLAAASGFYLLYWKEGIRVDGYQDWGVWWHVAWSWAAAVFFWQHTWVNRVSLGHFFRRSLRTMGPALMHGGLYAAVLVALVVTWGPAKGAFVNENYIPLSLWTWIGATTVAYAAWLLLRHHPHAAQKKIRGGVDLALVPASALAVLSGIPLLWFDGAMDQAGLKYASKFWHVWPSVVFSVLVFVHSVQLWTGLRRHWQRLGQDAPLDAQGEGPAG